MRIAFLLFSFAAALAIAFAQHRARAIKLRRLVQMTGMVSARSSRADTSSRLFERVLPRTLARDLRLLELDPAPRDAAAIVAVHLLALALAFKLAGTAAAVIVALAIPALGAAALNILANRRIRELALSLPAFFDRVRQLLVIGNSLPTAFARAVSGGQPRLAAFFAPALRRIANGAGFAESIRQSAEDVPLYEMQLFSAAVSTNMRFGGSLTHSLSNLVLFLRKRSAIERELRAGTALIRSSAWVLGFLPVLVAALIVVQNRAYAHWFVADPTGKSLLVYCVVSQAVGAVVMRSIVRTEF